MKTVKISLKESTDFIERFAEALLDQRDKYNVTVDAIEAQKLVDALEGLRIVVETTQLA